MFAITGKKTTALVSGDAEALRSQLRSLTPIDNVLNDSESVTASSLTSMVDS